MGDYVCQCEGEEGEEEVGFCWGVHFGWFLMDGFFWFFVFLYSFCLGNECILICRVAKSGRGRQACVLKKRKFRKINEGMLILYSKCRAKNAASLAAYLKRDVHSSPCWRLTNQVSSLFIFATSKFGTCLIENVVD